MKPLRTAVVIGVLALAAAQGCTEIPSSKGRPITGSKDGGVNSNRDSSVDLGDTSGQFIVTPGALTAASLQGTTTSRDLIEVDLGTGSGSPAVIGTVSPAVPRTLTFDPGSGVLWAIVDKTTSPKLYTINPCSGAATLAFNLTSIDGQTITAVEAVAFNAFDQQLYAAVGVAAAISSIIATIDTTTGILTTVATLNGPLSDIDAMAFVDGELYAVNLTGAAPDTDSQLAHVELPSGLTTIFATETNRRIDDLAYDATADLLFGIDTTNSQVVAIGTGEFSGQLVPLSTQSGLLAITSVSGLTCP